MVVLDTNVLSEVLRPVPDEHVVSWLEAQPRQQLFTTAVTRAEILYGVAVLPKGQRRHKLWQAALGILDEEFGERVLSFDGEAADRYAEIGAARKTAGRLMSQFDAMIAAIARSHGARLATRNVEDFEGCGIELVNPWR